jgi:hypothetical protein
MRDEVVEKELKLFTGSPIVRINFKDGEGERRNATKRRS